MSQLRPVTGDGPLFLGAYMRNNRFNVGLHDEFEQFVRYIPTDRAVQLLAQGKARILRYAGAVVQRVRAIALLPVPPPPSKSGNNPASITLADVLANVGLPCTIFDDWERGSHESYISAGRVRAAQDKVEEWDPLQGGASWADRIVSQAPHVCE